MLSSTGFLHRSFANVPWKASSEFSMSPIVPCSLHWLEPIELCPQRTAEIDTPCSIYFPPPIGLSNVLCDPLLSITDLKLLPFLSPYYVPELRPFHLYFTLLSPTLLFLGFLLLFLIHWRYMPSFQCLSLFLMTCASNAVMCAGKMLLYLSYILKSLTLMASDTYVQIRTQDDVHHL